MQFHTTEQLGVTQAMTPEGFLVCYGVPIARVGAQVYSELEIPTKGDRGGLIRVIRSADEVFRPETIKSFEGKPVTLDHPDEFVTPATYKELAVGHAQNVRRGEGIETDLLVADLLITDPEAITAVTANQDAEGNFVRPLREVSCGYDADYVEQAPGTALQKNIVGNHIALVARGRAGPRCSIKDGETIMPAAKKLSFMDKLRLAFATKDGEAFEKALKEGEKTDDGESDEDDEEGKKAKTGDSVAIAKLTKTVDGLVKAVAGLVKTKDADDEPEKKKTDDDEIDPDMTTDDDGTALTVPGKAKRTDQGMLYTGDSLKAVISNAEILAPGYKMPTTDSFKTKDAVAKTQRLVLAQAMGAAETKDTILGLLDGRTIDSLTAEQTAATFDAATVMVKAQNNSKGARSGISTKDFGARKGVAEINAAQKAFWDAKKTVLK